MNILTHKTRPWIAAALALGLSAHALADAEWSSFILPAPADRNGPVLDEAYALIKQEGPWTRLETDPLRQPEQRLMALLKQGQWAAAMDWMKQQHPDLNVHDPLTGATPLSVASLHGQLDLVREMIRRGAALDVPGVNGWTPLAAAVFQGQELVAKELLRKGARWDAPSRGGQLPLHLACATGQLRMIDLLLANGADWRAYNRQGRHAMEEAALFGHIDAMKELVAKAGAQYDAADQFGLNAVHAAALGYQKDTLDFLAQQKVPVPSAVTQVLVEQTYHPVPLPLPNP
ncbi:MAG TPA: ankyrin repeat domain-containing protein [Aquabacterium sp.]|nr:ankyrin repeat domain-containing protein [Aquabacterium sp.]